MGHLKRNWVAIIVVAGVIACLISIGFYIYIFGSNGFSKNNAHWGTFGDYVGGFLGTILALISVLLIYITYRNQVISTRIQQFETTFFNLIDRIIHLECKAKIGNN